MTKVAAAVRDHKHLVVEHPDRQSKQVGFTQLIHEAHGETELVDRPGRPGRPTPGGFVHVTYEDVKKCMVILKGAPHRARAALGG